MKQIYRAANIAKMRLRLPTQCPYLRLKILAYMSGPSPWLGSPSCICMHIYHKNLTKQILRAECLPALGAQWSYFSIDDIRACMTKRRVICHPQTINRYLAEFIKDRLIYPSGRGWYSAIKELFELDTSSMGEIAEELGEHFPFLAFSCWSTEQINPWMHHLLGKSISFVYAEQDSMKSVYEWFQDAGWRSYLNPTRLEAGKVFSVAEKTVVIRPLIQRAPTIKNKFASIEKILIDLFIESSSLNIMSILELQEMTAKLIKSARLSMGSLVSYAKRRKISLSDIFPKEESIISALNI
ncbi:MAG: hypothetical protein NTX50_02250 [Candidatus Sumerlaeota bacterium]|nr:hypothetical protein [Candidatus Sumerlaeota bacterium]